MVKFSQQFHGQLVPEWKEAFVDYWQLKRDINRIHPFNLYNHDSNHISNHGNFLFLGNNRGDHASIQVHRKHGSSASKDHFYETELLDQFGETDTVKDFFAGLDEQLNKVDSFYRSKEKEFLERGECLKKQMEILEELKEAIKQKRSSGSDSSRESNEDVSISCRITCAEEGSIQDAAEQDEVAGSESPGCDAAGKPIGIKTEDQKARHVISCQGKILKINIPLSTPSRTFSAITYLIREDMANQSSKKCGSHINKLHINKTKLHHAKKMIKGALLELYKGLTYLKTYRNLNMLAFMKILKKFDKVTGKQVLPIYLRVVESSYFNSSDKVLNLTDELEDLFVKHFAADDRRKAMKYLKPNQRKESHAVTFFIGLFSGCCAAFLIGYIIMAHVTGIYKRRSMNNLYVETVYPILSMFALMFLHLFLYGCNIFTWRKTRINYSFIFELGPSRELKYRDVFLICASAMTIVVGTMFTHLSLLTKQYSYSQVQPILGLLLSVFLLLLLCPFNIFYKSSRYRFLSIIKNIILSPFYKVVMLDFFMADQLCSQVPMLRNLEYVVCYYITGSYKTLDYGYCTRTKFFRDLAYAISFLPYYWRAMQCARRWFDEGKMNHLVNLGKYVSAMLAAGAKVAYEKDMSMEWLCIVVVVSSCATIYQLYWDFVKDWGLLQPNSKNPWLRNELMLRKKSIYFFSMGLNIVLRLAWLKTVIHYNFQHVDYRVTELFVAALEVIRRGQWNFYRLENEHLNNVGKFRAVKTVPLPFHEVDEED